MMRTLTFRKVIEVEGDVMTFCGGCNNQITMKKFIAVDEGQTFEDAWKHRDDNESDEIFIRRRFMGFCLCGNVYLFIPSSTIE